MTGAFRSNKSCPSLLLENVHSTLYIKFRSLNQGKMFVNTTMAYLVVGVASEASGGVLASGASGGGEEASEASRPPEASHRPP